MKIEKRPIRTNLFAVFSRDKALTLVDMGNPIVDAAPNKKNPNFVAFYFENTKKVRADFKYISED